MYNDFLNANYKKLLIWQRGIELADHTYVYTEHFPANESYGLQSQMRSAAVSIPSNIAEGSRRGTNKDFAKFIRIARGSLAELDTQRIIAHRRRLLMKEQSVHLENTIEELGAMLYAFHAKLAKPTS